MTPVATQSIPPRPPRKQIDSGAFWGIALAAGGVISALVLQGGQVSDLLQWSSALLLLAGTAGAVLITTPLGIVRDAARGVAGLLRHDAFDGTGAVTLVCVLSRKAQRFGIAALESELPSLIDPFLREAVCMASDGATPDEVVDRMRLETRLTRMRLDRQARVFETAAGYAPTLGILGAVLGLIQVMKHLNEMEAVGHGIAAAFVSTVYGLALANLLLLPIAGRLRAAAAQKILTQELLTDGVLCMMQKLHPLAIEARLAPYLISSAERAPSAASQKAKMQLAKGA